MDEEFLRRWAFAKGDIQETSDLFRVFACQLVATLLILYVVRPGFVLKRSSVHASETLNIGATLVIALIICILTFYHPSLGVRIW